MPAAVHKWVTQLSDLYGFLVYVSGIKHSLYPVGEGAVLTTDLIPNQNNISYNNYIGTYSRIPPRDIHFLESSSPQNPDFCQVFVDLLTIRRRLPIKGYYYAVLKLRILPLDDRRNRTNFQNESKTLSLLQT